MGTRKIVTAAAGLLITVLLVAGCTSGQGSESADPGRSGTVAGSADSTVVSGSAPDSPPTPVPPTVGCTDQGMNPSDWNTAEDTAPPRNPTTDGGIDDVTPSAGACFDQVVVRTDTTSDVGFAARYVPLVTQDASGRPVPLQGEAFLQWSVFAPVADPALFQGFGFTADDTYRTLRQIAFAGSFEGVTTFGVGVDTQVPFAVESRKNARGATEIVLYLAH